MAHKMLSFALVFVFSVHALKLASAHVTVDPGTISLDGSYFRVAMRVPHGCGEGEGDDRVYYATERVEGTVPPGIAAESTARAEWIAGWPSSFTDMVCTQSPSRDWLTYAFLPRHAYGFASVTHHVCMHGGALQRRRNAPNDMSWNA